MDPQTLWTSISLVIFVPLLSLVKFFTAQEKQKKITRVGYVLDIPVHIDYNTSGLVAA